jgi:ureidoglycolate lyase
MSQSIKIQQLTPEAFAPFGDVLDCAGEPDRIINAGFCGRYHDRAKLEHEGGKLGVSLFRAEPRQLPYALSLLERHPLGCQTFIPMHEKPFLVIVAQDEDGQPGNPIAFETSPGQAINFHMNVWHGVLTPLHAPGLFAVVDRIGDEANLQEHHFDRPWTVER